MLMESPLTKRVYVVTSYIDEGNGIFIAREKHDVTEQFDVLAAMRCECAGGEEREQIKRYSFEHDEITCCADCPFFYDYIFCLIDKQSRKFEQYTWSEDEQRPDWCPMKEVYFTEVQRLNYRPSNTKVKFDGDIGAR